MRHLVHGVVAALGAAIAVLLSSAMTSAVWSGGGRIGPQELLTMVVCAAVFWAVLEVKDLRDRRAARAPRQDVPPAADRSI